MRPAPGESKRCARIAELREEGLNSLAGKIARRAVPGDVESGDRVRSTDERDEPGIICWVSSPRRRIATESPTRFASR